MKNILNRGDRNIAILDVEASALERGSFPIEVGVALIRGPSEPIVVGAKLLQPTIKWLETGVWSKFSEAGHGISLAVMKRDGEPVEVVCDWLNGLLGSNTIVATDAPRYDQDWLDTLFDAAGRSRSSGFPNSRSSRATSARISIAISRIGFGMNAYRIAQRQMLCT